jgi:uncharacterized phage protein (TIGR02218 family)
MRSIGLLRTHLDQEVVDEPVVRALKIVKRTGEIIGLIDWVNPVEYDDHTYIDTTGLNWGSVSIAVNEGPSKWEFDVSDTDRIDPLEVKLGLFDNAQITMFEVVPDLPDIAFNVIWEGDAGQVTFNPETGFVEFECVGILGRATVRLIERYSPMCRALFGDNRCKVDRDSITVFNVTVAAVSLDGFYVTVSGVSEGDDYFNLCKIVAVDGPIEGRQAEIKDWTNGTQVLRLYVPLIGLEVGDLINIVPGCSYDIVDETGCPRWANILNYQGEPHVPGQEAASVTRREWGE